MATGNVFKDNGYTYTSGAVNNDAGQTLVTVNQFYVSTSGKATWITKLMYYAAGAMVGSAVKLLLYIPGNALATNASTGLTDAIDITLASGWNEVTLPTPRALPVYSGSGAIQAFSVGVYTGAAGNYVAHDLSSSAAIPSALTGLLFAQSTDAGLTPSTRGSFRYGGWPTPTGANGNFNFWNGTDIQVTDVNPGTTTVTKTLSFAWKVKVPPLTRAAMPAAGEGLTLTTAPTITQSTSQTITGSLIGPTDSRLEYTGSGSDGMVTATLAGFVRPEYEIDKGTAGTGTDPWIIPPWGARIKTDSQNVEVLVRQRDLSAFSSIGNRSAVRVKVNGQWTSLDPVYLGATPGYPSNPDSLANATAYYVKLAFASATMREIEFQSNLEFGGFVVATGASVVLASSPQHTIALLGDSLTGGEKHGTGNFTLTGVSVGTFTGVTSHLWYEAQDMGYDNVINSGVGSTGFAIGGESVAYTNATRIANDIVAYAPELVIVGTAANDIGAARTSTQVGTDTATVLTALRTALPNTIIVVMGTPNVPALGAGSYSTAATTVAPYNTAQLAKAILSTAWFINPVTGILYDPTGAVAYTDPSGGWLTGHTADISSDNMHPTQSGQAYFGSKLAEYLRLTHPSGVSTTTVTKTLAFTWKVRAQVNKTLGLTWKVRQAVTKTLANTWKVRQAVTKTLASTWKVRVAVTKTLSSTWNLKQTISKTLASSWNVRVSVTKTLPFTWKVRSAVTKTVGFAWNTLAGSGITTITKTIAFAWNTRQQVTKTLPSAWSVRVAVTKVISSTWKVRQQVTKLLPLSWKVRQQITKQVPSSWPVRVQVNKTLVSSWKVRAVVNKAVAFAWKQRVRVTKLVDFRWNTDGTQVIASMTLMDGTPVEIEGIWDGVDILFVTVSIAQ